MVVREIPDDVHDPVQEIWKFFDKRIGKVQDVQVALNTSELLGLANERDKVSGAFEIAKAKWKKNKEDPDVSQQKVDRLEREARQKKAELRGRRGDLSVMQNDKMGAAAKHPGVRDVPGRGELPHVSQGIPPGNLRVALPTVRASVPNTHRLVVKRRPCPRTSSGRTSSLATGNASFGSSTSAYSLWWSSAWPSSPSPASPPSSRAR